MSKFGSFLEKYRSSFVRRLEQKNKSSARKTRYKFADLLPKNKKVGEIKGLDKK